MGKLNFIIYKLQILDIYNLNLANPSSKKRKQPDEIEQTVAQPDPSKIIVGRITAFRYEVLGEGCSSVYVGTFNGNPCAVKRLLKTDGEKRDKIAEDVLREIKVWLTLSDEKRNLHVAKCFGYEQNDSFW